MGNEDKHSGRTDEILRRMLNTPPAGKKDRRRDEGKSKEKRKGD